MESSLSLKPGRPERLEIDLKECYTIMRKLLVLTVFATLTANLSFAEALARTSREDDLKYLDPSRTSADVTGTNGAAWKGVAK